MKGSRAEGSRGWNWVRMVGECGRLCLSLTMNDVAGEDFCIFL